MTDQKNKFNECLLVSECQTCSCIVWPMSTYCNKCLSKTHIKKISQNGKLLEFSKKGDNFFGVVEFENEIKIMGIIHTEKSSLEVGQVVKLVKFEKNNNHRFEFST